MAGFSRSLVYWTKVVSLGIVFGFGIQMVSAWVAPSATPPGGNVAGPLTTGAADQVKAGKLYTSSTLTTDPGQTLVTKDYVDAASYVRGAHYGGCTQIADASVWPWVLAASTHIAWPVTSCPGSGRADANQPVCAAGFTRIIIGYSQLNTSFSGDVAFDGNYDRTNFNKLNGFLDGDMMMKIYACAKE